MRYMNWDVLLFPEGSKTPLQEFKTNCYITQDPGPISHQNPFRHGVPDAYHTKPRYVPTVASFVPSIPLGSPFKVSIHSWEPPVTSPDTQALAGEADKIFFEARVLVDGVTVAGIFFDQQPPWPQVIDTCSDPNRGGMAAPLTFPTFHSEMIMYNHWNAGENLGRIKVLIAEGICRGQAFCFEKSRSIICFAFQHAPLRVLEDSYIAYPNAGMLYQMQNEIFGPPSPRKVQGHDSDAYGHSPRQRVAALESLRSKIVAGPALSYQDYLAATVRPCAPRLGDPSRSPGPLSYDIFTDDARYHAFSRFAARSSSGDASMPDDSRSLTPASSRNHSDHQNITQREKVAHAANHSDVMCEQLDISPNRPVSAGTIAPANTRVSSENSTPTIRKKPSVAARTTPYSHTQARAVTLTTRDPQQPTSAIRESSDVSMQTAQSKIQKGAIEQDQAMVRKKPARDVKGRKEGKADELEIAEQVQKKRSAETIRSGGQENIERGELSLLTDSKRKRSAKVLFPADRALNETDPNCSPSRKVSKVETPKIQERDDITTEGVVVRTPVAQMVHIR